MADSRNSGRIKKYGVCLNDKCAKYKEVQEIVHGDMECPCCKKKLSPCAPPKKKKAVSKQIVFVVFAIIILAALGVGGYFLFKTPESPISTEIGEDTVVVEEEVPVDVYDSIADIDTVTITNIETRVDTVKIEKTTEIEKTPTLTTTKTTTVKTSTSTGASSGTIRLSYGTYTGAIKNGYPHGQGKLTYTKSRQINKNDMKGRVANSGEYIIGEFFNGFVVYGKHYDSDGNLLGSLNFGVGSEDSYESK